MSLEDNKNYFRIPSENVRVLAVSDLHKGHTAPSKKWIKKHDNLVDDTLEEVLLDKNIDILVLNGDIFEGYETPYKKSEMRKRIKEYINDLNDKNTRNIPIIYVVGNHDDKGYMVKTLKKLAKKIDNFHVYKEYVIIGNVLFAHGDLYLRLDENPNKRKLGNQANHTFKPPFMEGGVYGHIYALLRNPVQFLADATKSNPDYVIDTINSRMKKEQPKIYELIKAVVTGHIHNLFIKNKYDKWWGNSGTSVHEDKLGPIAVNISSNGEVNLSFYRGANKGVGR